MIRVIEALQTFLASDDGANLLTGYKRAANILRIEEKKDKTDLSTAIPIPKPQRWPRKRRFQAAGPAVPS